MGRRVGQVRKVRGVDDLMHRFIDPVLDVTSHMSDVSSVSRLVHLSTQTVRCLDAGAGRPVVFLHGFPLGADQWLPQILAVPKGWRFVAPDLRGFGGADPGGVAGGITMDTYASDAIELMAHLEIPRAVIAGLSMGGYVALAMARRAPTRVAGLVLADTRATADNAEARAGRDATLARLHRDGPLGVGRAMLPKLLGTTTRREQPDLAEAITRIVEENTPDGLAAAIIAMRDRPDSTPLLASLACPTVVIVGDEDVMTPPAECEALHHAIPGSRYVCLPGAGHLSNIENPAAFTAAVLSLVDAVPAP
jgi:3-oxoadipate enol-lactonase